MIELLPSYVTVVFIATTLLTVFIFFRAAHHARAVIAVIGLWMLLQGIVSYTGFYTNTFAFPPRFPLLVAPPVLLIVVLFLTSPGKNFIDSLDLKWLTWLHVVRVPVELVLFWLFKSRLVPELMTFEGRNFDILSGLTAPFIFYFGFVRNTLNKKVILAWNIICLVLLFNIVGHAVLSAPSPFQQLAFEQPNIGVMYFPFVWLPGVIVPLVLFAHLAAIRQLTSLRK